MSRKHWTDEKLFSRLLHNKSDHTYWENIRELHSRCNEFVFKKSYQFAQSNSKKEKIIGIDVLAQLGAAKRPFEKETLQLFFELLAKETDPEVLMSILYGIGHNNYKTLGDNQIEFLVFFAKHDDKFVRQGLVSALLRVKNPVAIETLIFLMKDKVSSIRDWATFGIGTQLDKNTQKIRNALWERVNDKNQDTKLEAIVGLGKRKDIRVKEIIIRELLDGEFGTLLFEAIEEFNDKEFLPFLYQTLEKSKSDKSINPIWLEDLRNCINKLENQT
jgi:hypothetical protein